MKTLLTVLGGLSVAAALAVFPATSAAHGGDPEDLMQGLSASMRQAMVVAPAAKAVTLTIVHVQRGCHAWTDGKRTAPGVKLVVRRGTRVTVANMDLDAHKLVRLGGPRLRLGPPLKMNTSVTLRFAKPGVYRLMTKKIETPGEMDVKTLGPDNVLGLTVVVR